jgi:hypothetical protein
MKACARFEPGVGAIKSSCLHNNPNLICLDTKPWQYLLSSSQPSRLPCVYSPLPTPPPACHQGAAHC